MKKSKSSKPIKQAHTSRSKYGMGDSYGSGVRQKVGLMRDSFMPEENPISKKGLKKPPRSLA